MESADRENLAGRAADDERHRYGPHCHHDVRFLASLALIVDVVCGIVSHWNLDVGHLVLSSERDQYVTVTCASQHSNSDDSCCMSHAMNIFFSSSVTLVTMVVPQCFEMCHRYRTTVIGYTGKMHSQT